MTSCFGEHQNPTSKSRLQWVQSNSSKVPSLVILILILSATFTSITYMYNAVECTLLNHWPLYPPVRAQSANLLFQLSSCCVAVPRLNRVPLRFACPLILYIFLCSEILFTNVHHIGCNRKEPPYYSYTEVDILRDIKVYFFLLLRYLTNCFLSESVVPIRLRDET